MKKIIKIYYRVNLVTKDLESSNKMLRRKWEFIFKFNKKENVKVVVIIFTISSAYNIYW